jgi:glycosyltransferase involved in cell wall biosynthesis
MAGRDWTGGSPPAGMVIGTCYSAGTPRKLSHRTGRPPLKILRIIARLNVGGPARHVALLNTGLQSRGHDTRLVYGALDTGEASLEGPARDSGIPLVRIADLGRSVRPGSDLRAFVALLRLMFREQPDVVHTHTAKAGTLGRLAALVYNSTRPAARRALVVHTFHGHVFEGYFSPALNTLVRAAERALGRVTDRIITISPRQQYDIATRFEIAPIARTSVVPLGLDLDAPGVVGQG